MAAQLLREWYPFEVDKSLVNESYGSGKPLVVKGVLQRADAKNHNGRVYPRPILEREVEKYRDGFVTQKRALGELDHPDSSVVNLAKVSHNVLEISWDGNDVVGTVEVLPTPAGNILKELFKAGITVGISSRGLGSVKENDEGSTQVLDDFELIAFDFVSNPSTHEAFMFPIKRNVNEGVSPQEPYKYSHIDNIIHDILCSTAGVCKINLDV